MTKQQLQEELKQSMLARNELKTSVLRMLISEIKYFEMKKAEEEYDKKYAGQMFTTENPAPSITFEATEEDMITVIQKEGKKRRDSIGQFKSAGRQELVDKETEELKILESYLPAQMGEEEIRNIVKETVTESGATSMQDIGKLMGALMPKIKGKADGSLVNKIVREELNKS